MLDADCLIPPGLRDLLLSCAETEDFAPVWSSQIEREVLKNGVKLLERKGVQPFEAIKRTTYALAQMNRAFPGARVDDDLWRPVVAGMTNHEKDRHVLAAAIGAEASHVITSNIKDFPEFSWPTGVAVQRPDAFLLDRLEADPDRILEAVHAMAARHERPAHTSLELARKLRSSPTIPRFGAAVLALMEPAGRS